MSPKMDAPSRGLKASVLSGVEAQEAQRRLNVTARLDAVEVEVEAAHNLLDGFGVPRGSLQERLETLHRGHYHGVAREVELRWHEERRRTADLELEVQAHELALDKVTAVAVEALVYRRRPWRALRKVAQLALREGRAE